MNEPAELVECHLCKTKFVLQDDIVFEGVGSSWCCSCPECGAVVNPETEGVSGS
jgi:hypothetical protein